MDEMEFTEVSFCFSCGEGAGTWLYTFNLTTLKLQELQFYPEQHFPLLVCTPDKNAKKTYWYLQAHSNMMDLINEYQQYQNAGVYEEGEDEDEYTEEYQH